MIKAKTQVLSLNR
ncbi:hypothetical protein D050_0858, partial [Vibrio parahaemolyticus VPCR-2009]